MGKIRSDMIYVNSGDIFSDSDGKKYLAVRNGSCNDCDLRKTKACLRMRCSDKEREDGDGEYVSFKRVYIKFS